MFSWVVTLRPFSFTSRVCQGTPAPPPPAPNLRSYRIGGLTPNLEKSFSLSGSPRDFPDEGLTGEYVDTTLGVTESCTGEGSRRTRRRTVPPTEGVHLLGVVRLQYYTKHWTRPSRCASETRMTTVCLVQIMGPRRTPVLGVRPPTCPPTWRSRWGFRLLTGGVRVTNPDSTPGLQT